MVKPTNIMIFSALKIICSRLDNVSEIPCKKRIFWRGRTAVADLMWEQGGLQIQLLCNWCCRHQNCVMAGSINY